MKYLKRKLVKPGELNSNGTLFGGNLLAWIDEEAAIFSMCQLGRQTRLVTKYMSEINFVSSAKNGDIIEFGFQTVKFGTTSITVKSQVRNKFTQEVIITIDNIVFVAVDENGKPKPHGIKNPLNDEV